MMILAHAPRRHSQANSASPGLLLHDAAHYDALVWLFTLGREGTFRKRILQLARLAPGEAVLDVGCGTGSLAIEAKRRVGASGAVCAIDASPEMLAGADRKARKAGTEVLFSQAPAQALPFPDARFDVILSTLMLHHLPRKARGPCIDEMARVLKPGGRVLVVDFSKPRPGRKGLLDRFHRHGHVEMTDIVALLEAAGLDIVASGPLGYRDLKFAIATTRG